MSEATKEIVLGCTADRSAYFHAVVPFAIIVVVEAGVLAFAGLAVFHAPGHRIGAVVAVVGIVALAAFTLAAPLASRHRLLPNALKVRFGVGLKSVFLDIPFEDIRAIGAAHERLVSTHALGPYVDAQRRRLVAVFSERGQVLIQLREAREVHFGPGRRAAVREVLINVDDPEPLLRALEAPAFGPPMKCLLPNGVPTPGPSPSLTARSSQLSRLPAAAPDRRSRAPAGEVLTLVEGLTRRYGEREAVRDLDVRLAAGEIYGLLGCNGAGKTTTIRMLVGLLEPTAGRVRVRGVDVWKDAVAARRATGFAPDAPLLYDRLTGREFLAFLAQLHDLSSGDAARRVADLLDEVDLSGDADRACGTYSLGMKRRLAFAAALVHRPAFLVLDEPLSGLDPRSTRRLKDRIRAVADTGTAVLLSTHDLTSAEELCDRIGVLHRGRLVAEGEASVVRSMASAPSLEAAFLALTSEELS